MLNLEKLEQLKNKLEAACWRIERYLEEQEVSTLTQEEVFKNIIYVQQRAKMTAYLFMLEYLDSDIPSKIKRRREVKMVDTAQGVVHDIKIYLESLEGLSTEEKIKKIRRDIPVPEWD